MLSPQTLQVLAILMVFIAIYLSVFPSLSTWPYAAFVPPAALLLLLNRVQRPKKLVVTGLFVYPVKSCGAIRLEKARINWLGFEHDREWMVVDKEGKFVTQRQYPKMLLIEPRLVDGANNDGVGLVLSAPGMDSVDVPNPAPDSKPRKVVVWDDTVHALDCGDSVGEWLSTYLGKADLRLVRLQSEHKHTRPVPEKYAKRAGLEGKASDGVQAAFSDAFPFLITTERSLEALNSRLEERGEAKVDMACFRPNIVVGGCKRAFIEDTWFSLTIGALGTRFKCVKPCSRCTIPSILPSGAFHPHFEPTRTLRKFRAVGEKVYFGQNAVHEDVGRELVVGDEVVVVAGKPAEPKL